MKMDTDFIRELNSIISQEAAKYRTDTLLPTDWTIEKVMKEQNLMENQARKVMDKLTKDGLFRKVKIYNGSGSPRIAYRPVEKKEE